MWLSRENKTALEKQKQAGLTEFFEQIAIYYHFKRDKADHSEVALE